jgi:hypothetical protein
VRTEAAEGTEKNCVSAAFFGCRNKEFCYNRDDVCRYRMIWFLFPAGSAAVQTGSGKKKCTQALKEKAENRQKGMQGRPESPEKAEKRKEEFGVIQEMKKQAFNPYLPLNE